MKFKIGDKARVCANAGEHSDQWLIHCFEIGTVVEIAGTFDRWKGHEAYNIKIDERISSEVLLAEELEYISVPVVEPQYEGDGKERYNIDPNKLYTVRQVHMQDLKDEDYFWTNRQGGGFINARVNKLRGKNYDNLVVLVLAVTPNEVSK